MSRFAVFLLALLGSTSILAEPIVYVCERPAWEGVKGCGPNNTHSTYAFHVETKDFRLKNPHYTLQKRDGCDFEKARKIRYHYSVSDETIRFKYQRPLGSPFGWKTIRLDRESLTAEMLGVNQNPNLKCRIEASESWIIKNPTYR